MSTLISEPRVDEPATGTRESWLINPQLPAASCVPEEGTGAYELLHRYDVGPLSQERIPRSYFKMARSSAMHASGRFATSSASAS